MREELGEVEAAMTAADPAAIEAEIGDLLFAVAQLARHLKMSAEDALTKSADRFTRRFHHLEAALAAQGRQVSDAGANELDVLWEAAKRAAT